MNNIAKKIALVAAVASVTLVPAASFSAPRKPQKQEVMESKFVKQNLGGVNKIEMNNTAPNKGGVNNPEMKNAGSMDHPVPRSVSHAPREAKLAYLPHRVELAPAPEYVGASKLGRILGAAANIADGVKVIQDETR